MGMFHLALAMLLATTDPESYCEPAGGPPTEEVKLIPLNELKPYVPKYSAAHLAYESSLLAALNGGSPRERALGAYDTLHATTPGNPQALGRQLHEAAAGAPADMLMHHLVSIAAGEGAGCPDTGACPERRAAATAEPDNAMAWIRAIDFRGEEDPEFDALIVKAAEAKRFDDHYVEAVVAWEQILRAHPMPREMLEEFLNSPRSGSSSDVVSNPEAAAKLYAELYAGPFEFLETKLDDSCRRSAHRGAPEARFMACATVGRRMMREGGASLTQMQGYYMIPEHLRTAEDEALETDLSWRLDRAVALGDASFGSAEAIAHFRDLVANGSVARADEMRLERFGISPKAPQGWKPCKLRPY